MRWKIVETDNHGSDYPNEKFVTPLPVLSKEVCEMICWIINQATNHRDLDADRFSKVVDENYTLQPGFEP